MDLFDLVFEKRNKEYGAYYLRKKYVKYLAISFSVTLLIALIFTGYAIAYKLYSFKPVPFPRGVVYEPTYLSEEEIAAPEVPKELPEEKLMPSQDKPNEIPIVTDSLKNVAQKEKEIPKTEEKKEEDQDSSVSTGPQGVANGEITIPIERFPEFPGGEKARILFLQQNFRLNQISKTQRVRGIVKISFIVRKDGRVEDIKIIQHLSPEIDKECLRIVSTMPLWKPAISGGKPIDFTHILPFNIAF